MLRPWLVASHTSTTRDARGACPKGIGSAWRSVDEIKVSTAEHVARVQQNERLWIELRHDADQGTCADDDGTEDGGDIEPAATVRSRAAAVERGDTGDHILDAERCEACEDDLVDVQHKFQSDCIQNQLVDGPCAHEEDGPNVA